MRIFMLLSNSKYVIIYVAIVILGKCNLAPGLLKYVTCLVS